MDKDMYQLKYWTLQDWFWTSEGKGMGNQFLDDLRTAKALIHVVDSSGTDEEGNQSENYNPMSDIKWLGLEIQIGYIKYYLTVDSSK